MIIVACIMLVGLFALQHRGTQSVDFPFAPVVIINWLLFIGVVGLFNIVRLNATIYHTLSPHYIIKFFRRTRKDGWFS